MSSGTIRTVGLLSPGDMGHSVGNVLRHGGKPVITCLEGRSGRSAELAAQAGIMTVESMEELVQQADLFLSIVPPAKATEVAESVAAALSSTGTGLVYLDCNAIAPETTRNLGRIVEAAGATFVDGGIIGPPPKIDGPNPRVYVSGAQAGIVEQLKEHGLDVRKVSDVSGHASAVKMCYAALTKGLSALGTELLVAARAMGVDQPLRAEFEHSQRVLLEHFERQIPGMPPKAYRWVGEMEEIAKTFEDVGLTPRILLGAADMYRLVGETPLANETPEQRNRGQTLGEVIEILNEVLTREVTAD